jgi:hypothetical protein
MIKALTTALGTVFATSSAIAFDLADYAMVQRATLDSYRIAVDDFRTANAEFRGIMEVAVNNTCEVGYSSSATNVDTNEFDFDTAAGGHYSAVFEAFQVSAEQCDILYLCSDTDTACRASRRACIASAINAERANDLEGAAINTLITDYEQTNLGQFASAADSPGAEVDFAGIKSDLEYVDTNGERPGYASVETPAEVISGLETILLAAGYDANLVAQALSTGLPANWSEDSESERLRLDGTDTEYSATDSTFDSVCEAYNTYRYQYTRALNEVALAYAPMAAARAGYRAATEVYLGSSNCAVLPHDGEWDFTGSTELD